MLWIEHVEENKLQKNTSLMILSSFYYYMIEQKLKHNQTDSHTVLRV